MRISDWSSDVCSSDLWTGLSYEERLSGGQAPALYALSLFVVFLCLAALYESWSVPISVLLVVPLGVIGAVFAAWITGLNSDIYLQVGLITTIGVRSEEHTSELQSLMRISYAVFCLKK